MPMFTHVIVMSRRYRRCESSRGSWPKITAGKSIIADANIPPHLKCVATLPRGMKIVRRKIVSPGADPGEGGCPLQGVRKPALVKS